MFSVKLLENGPIKRFLRLFPAFTSLLIGLVGGAVGGGQQTGARVTNYYNTQQRHGNHITGRTGVNKLIDLFSIICLFLTTESFHQSANKIQGCYWYLTDFNKCIILT